MAKKCVSSIDGNILIGGYEEVLFLFKVSPSGNIIWNLDNNYDYTSCVDLLNTLDGGIVLLSSSSLGYRIVHFIKLNNDGVTYGD
jgi:hypothetical protein